jgi:hypothetical protein
VDDTSTTTATLDQAEEEILTYTVSDEALEAAAGPERGDTVVLNLTQIASSTLLCC